MKTALFALPGLLALFMGQVPAQAEDAPIQVGSKAFTESVVLGEILTQLIQSTGRDAFHRKELGGTPVLFNGKSVV